MYAPTVDDEIVSLRDSLFETEEFGIANEVARRLREDLHCGKVTAQYKRSSTKKTRYWLLQCARCGQNCFVDFGQAIVSDDEQREAMKSKLVTWFVPPIQEEAIRPWA